MSSTKGHLFRFFAGSFLQRARVTAVERIGPFVRVELDAIAGAQAGDKLQLLLPDNDVRTYRPVLGPRPHLIAYVHGDAPGPRWAQSVRAGDELQFKGPDRCIDLPEGAVTIVGDETSVATALSYAHARPGRVTSLIEGEAPFEGVQTFSRGDYAGIAAAVRGDGAVALTGGAALVQGVRDALRARSIRAKAKAYWAPGRVGLD